MRLRVKFFATYRETTGVKEVSWTATDGATLADILDAVLSRYPRLAGHRETMLLAVNHEFADPSAILADGDEVALLPPVSGGGA